MQGGAEAGSAGIRERARKLQELHVRLLFCHRTRNLWRTAPEEVLSTFGLEGDARGLLADIEGAQFQAEAHGRRVGVQKGVERGFPKTQKYLAAQADAAKNGPPSFEDSPGFEDFLGSDHFFDPSCGLPHSSGIGSGYENISKYFFWLRDAHRLAHPETDVTLRNSAYEEFATYLINQYNQPHVPYFDRFKGGLFWRREPGRELPVMLLSDKYALFTLASRETIAQLPVIGLIDLDDLVPEPGQASAMI